MALGTTNYPLGKLLLECLRASKMSIQLFVLAIGYRNPNKGVRAFDGMLANGHPDKVFLERLSTRSFAPAAQLLQEAIRQTVLLLEQEEQETVQVRQQSERDAFKPFFQAVPELKAPKQVCIFALTGGHSHYTHYLPASFPLWPLVDQYRYLETKVTEAFAASDGLTPFMGRITAYRLFCWYNGPSLLLSVHGKPLGQQAAAPLPDVVLGVGGRTISPAQARCLFPCFESGR